MTDRTVLTDMLHATRAGFRRRRSLADWLAFHDLSEAIYGVVGP